MLLESYGVASRFRARPFPRSFPFRGRRAVSGYAGGSEATFGRPIHFKDPFEDGAMDVLRAAVPMVEVVGRAFPLSGALPIRTRSVGPRRLAQAFKSGLTAS